MTPEEIKNAAVIAAANYDNPFDEPCYDKHFYDGFLAGAEYALANQWRDPKVELPEECERVLVHCEGFCTIAYFNGVEWHGNRYLKVLHWMPIPEPPKPEGK